MAQQKATEDEIVLVPVPKRFLAQVYQTLNEAWIEEPAESTPPSPTTTALRGWNKTDIAKLKRTVKNPTVRAMLDLTAAHAGEWVTYDDICSTVAREWAAVRGDLAGFSQLLRKKFSKEGRDKWPIEVEWRQSGTRYRMPLATACHSLSRAGGTKRDRKPYLEMPAFERQNRPVGRATRWLSLTVGASLSAGGD